MTPEFDINRSSNINTKPIRFAGHKLVRAHLRKEAFMKAGMIMAVLTISLLLSQNSFSAEWGLKKEFNGKLDLIEDINGDSKYELAEYRNDTLYIYDLQGTGVPEYAIPEMRVSSRFQLTEEYYIPLLDLNNDGIKDLILDDTGKVQVYDVAHQANIFEISEPTATYMECVALRDLDNDNLIEMMVMVEFGYDTVTYQGIYKTRIYSTPVALSVADNDGSENHIPANYRLEQNYPNPFNPTTIIGYQVQRAGHVTLSIYNVLGQLVNSLVDDMRSAGEYSVQWDGQDESGRSVASGVYFYQLKVDDFLSSKKMVILK